MASKPPFTYRDLCAAVGRSVLAWSSAEQTLDMCVTLVFKHCNGDTLRKDLPRPLGKKTEFMRDAFRQLPMLKHLYDEGTVVMNYMDEIARQRHEMAHSALATTETPSDGVWHFMKFDYGKDLHTARAVKFSAQYFIDAEKKMKDLGEQMLALLNKIKRLAPWPR